MLLHALFILGNACMAAAVRRQSRIL